MNHDYEKELGRSTERRSRRNPKAPDMTGRSGSGAGVRRESRKELDVMGGASMRSSNRTQYRAERTPESSYRATRQEIKTGAANQTARPRFSPEQPVSRSSYPASGNGRTAHQTAARQTAAGSGSGGSSGGGFSGREQTARKKRKKRRIITMIVAECFALAFIFGYGYLARTLNQIQRPTDVKLEQIKANNDLNVETVERMKGYWTIAIFGVDARDNSITKDTNADVNLICNINRDTGEIKLVSVYRDTYLNISDKGSYNKINQAYFVGGPEQAMQALNKNLDLDISDYVTFNWKAVADAINVLGGVDIELSKAEFYYINSFITETVKATGVGSHQLTHAGMNHLDGVQAVAYGRLRLMDTDFARTERQRKVIAQAFEKAKKADFKTLNVLIGTVFPQVSTSIWVDDLVSNAKNISKFHLGETTGFPQARGDVRMGKKGSVVVPQTLESNVVKLHEFLFGDEVYSPSQTVKNISSKIAADSGLYKEGKYIEKVGTEGGVIQQPKQTKKAETEKETKEADEDDKKESTKESSKNQKETDEDGKPVKETDEDGKPVRETDEDGNPVETTAKGTAAGNRPKEPETDENGDPIEPEEEEAANRPLRPTGPEDAEESSGFARPDAGSGVTGRPDGTGTTNRPTGGAGNGTGNNSTGTNAGTGNGTANRPDSTGTTSRPTGGTGNDAGKNPAGNPQGGASQTPDGNSPAGNAGTGTAPESGNRRPDGSAGTTAPVPDRGTGGPTAGPDGGRNSIPAPPPVNNGNGPGGPDSGNAPSSGVVDGPGM